MKYWEVGVCFRSSLLGSYCGGGHGRVIGVFVRQLFFFTQRSGEVVHTHYVRALGWLAGRT